MDAVADFEDLLLLLHRHKMRYPVIGGLAFIYHARPRHTGDMDLWIDPSPGVFGRASTIPAISETSAISRRSAAARPGGQISGALAKHE